MATDRPKWTAADESRKSSSVDSSETSEARSLCASPTVTVGSNGCPAMSAQSTNWDYESSSDSEVYSSVDESEPESESDSDFYVRSKCSAVELFDQKDQIINEECAVMLCNKNIRNQSDNLKFISFPKYNPTLCKMWWELCGHSDEYDPSFKICSIHFKPEDIVNILVEQDNQLFHQAMLKDICTVPSRFLKPHEILKLSSPMSMETSSDSSDSENETENKKCAFQHCNKMSLKDSKNTMFFRFPLENKILLKQWLDIIELPIWQLSETDVICSDHFENHDIIKINNCYKLNNFAFPSIKPVKPFVVYSEIFHSDSDENNLLLNDLEPNKMDDISLVCSKNELLKKRTDRKRRIENDTNFVSINSSPKKSKLQNEAVTDQPNSIETNNIEEKIVIPKSTNNGNADDYIYLDTLNDDNVGEFLAFETKCTSNSSRNNFSELVEINHNEETPKSILTNEDLTVCYGCMGLPKCEESCQRMCYYAVPDFDRRYIYKEFQMLNSVTEQNCEIAQLIHIRLIRRKSNTIESDPSYYLIVNNKSIEVCRLFFMNTLGIPECRLNAVLNPVHYSWYSNREKALKAEQPKPINEISESIDTTDFITNSLSHMKKDYNLYESESDSEVCLDNVSSKEYDKVVLYIKSIPRVLSSYRVDSKIHSFETSISLDYIYKLYSENYIKNKIPPPYTMRQFKRIYNQYMKSLILHV